VSAASAPEPQEPQEPGDRPPGVGLVPLRIPVLGASATAATELAAFHRALVAVGLGHYNLVRLSSVIPAATDVGPGRLVAGPVLPPRWRGARPEDFVDGRRGDRLYCVYAEARTEVPGEEVWAGVGWAQRADGQGGYFVEHHGTSADGVRGAIEASLGDMVADEAVEFGPVECVLEGVVCSSAPVCALVVVPYVAVGW
jgi:arginine decarboxylase